MVQKKWKYFIALSIAAALWGYAGEAARAEEDSQGDVHGRRQGTL